MFSGLVALSSIISKRVWIEQGYFKVFPNLYVVLVGPPGNRKTSAMDIALGLLRELKTIPLCSEAITKEKLVLDLAEQERAIEGCPDSWAKQRVYSPMTVMVTELSHFLGYDSAGMVDFLTTIYDRNFYDSRTKNKGDVCITGPALNLLACTTPDWITNYLRSDIISGGFSRRAIFVLETGKSGRIPFPEVTSEAQQAWNNLLLYSLKLFKVYGQFTWDTEAKKFYGDWYKKLEMPTEETITGYYETKHMQLLKISMLIALSESTDLVLRIDHLLFGLDLLKLAETNLLRVFAGIGRNELNTAATKVMDLLSKWPSKLVEIEGKKMDVPYIPEKKLRAAMFNVVDDQEMTSVLNHLIDTEKVGRATKTENGVVRNFIYLKPTKT